MAADVAPGGLFRAALEQYDASATWTCVDARGGWPQPEAWRTAWALSGTGPGRVGAE